MIISNWLSNFHPGQTPRLEWTTVKALQTYLLLSHDHNGLEGLCLPYLSFKSVSYVVDGRKILDCLTFDVERGEALVLLGSSGSGKTTALRLINRLLDPTSGTISIDGKDVTQSDPIQLRRKIGYVIQEFGLLPHWTVLDNVSLVPRLLSWPQEQQRLRSEELLKQVGLGDSKLAARKPGQLSGGQRQRVAVARALAAQPALLLFDEPFGALDPVTRHDMQQQFAKLQKQYNVAAVFVTHDLLEALMIGTRIAILGSGKLEALVSPREFWSVDTPVARAFRETLPPGLRPH
ncbi:MAG: ATP-binding cassette domain-containing protein [Acidobacteriaceae bacterium]|nr:ATP-binding cassette domain-containing protein [Acidobacteriaceae bacterium]